MPKTLYLHATSYSREYYENSNDPNAEPLTAYTEAEEAAHIREIVSLTLKNVSPIDLDRFTHEELVDRTIRAMGSAKASYVKFEDVPLTAALSAEQTQPVGYQQLKDGKWVECSHFVAFGWSDRLDKDCRPIYASPPLSREGEDTAEVYERCAKLAEERAAEVRYASWAVALKRLAQEIRALAATRSGSSSVSKGTDQ